MMSDLRYEWCLLHPRAVRTAVASCLPRAARGGLPPGTFLGRAKTPVPHTPTPLLLSPGPCLWSRGWATPRPAGLWGAAQQSLQEKGELWS